MLVKDFDLLKNTKTNLNHLDMFLSPHQKKELFINSFLNSSRENKKVLYIHTPFCQQKCKYCTCGSKANFSLSEYKKFYEETLPFQIAEYNEIFNKVQFDQVYFGGGTPTIAEAQVLESVFKLIPNFEMIPNKCLEASPHTLTIEHADLLKKYKFSFISIGIQSLEKSMCTKYNRQYVSHQELSNLSTYLRNNNIYFNYDLIAFLDKGDIRDLQSFQKEINYVLDMKPSCITIHQYYQSHFSIEKTKGLISLLNNVLSHHQDYICANSMLDPNDAEMDVLYQAEYRLVSENYNYYHYMWSKYASIPVQGYNILSLGYSKEYPTVSNSDKICYVAGEDKLSYLKYDPQIHNSFLDIRQKKGLLTD